MSEEHQDRPQDEERYEVDDEFAGAADVDAGEPGEAPDSAEIEQLRRERDELSQKVLRYAADYQNLARRAEQNVVAAREQQAIDLAKQLAVVLDHFDHALAVDAEKVSAKDLLLGVEMVQSELLSVLRRFGVERIDAQSGDEFDPSRHEAMLRQKTEGVESGRVAQQFQPGYMLREKIVRPAKVVVAE